MVPKVRPSAKPPVPKEKGCYSRLPQTQVLLSRVASASRPLPFRT